MTEYFEIAYATVSERLCLFTGTGFSRAITNDKIPSWKELMIDLCNDISPSLKEELFPGDGESPLSLEEIAQVISMKMKEMNLSIYDSIADKIKAVNAENPPDEIGIFFKNNKFSVITTNYDKLAESLMGESTSVAPGLQIPRNKKGIEVFHIHGSVDSPQDMIVTAEDYYRFINTSTYFSRKLSTMLHENTVVFIGYSFGDHNLKSIINEYTINAKHLGAILNMFFVSRDRVDKHVKIYFESCFGVRVIDGIETSDFFKNVTECIPEAESVKDDFSDKNIKLLLRGRKSFSDNFVRTYDALPKILAVLDSSGKKDSNHFAILGKLIIKKIKQTHSPGAWSQYKDLASWLVRIGGTFDVLDDSFSKEYMEGVSYSFRQMSSSKSLGYSWESFDIWKNGWNSVRPKNKQIIQKHLTSLDWWEDRNELHSIFT